MDQQSNGRTPDPIIPVGQWKPGADVQATWRKYGWVPPSESRTKFYDGREGVK